MTQPKKKGPAKKAARAPVAQPPPPPKDLIGRPSTYTREKADAVLALIIDADQPRSLRDACKEVGLKAGTFCGWVVEDHDGLAERYKRAQQVRANILADEIIAISDDGSLDYVATEDGGERVDHEHIQRSKLRVDTRK